MGRFDSLDIFRLLAAFAVVILHVSMGVLPLDFQIFIKLIARFAVPFFFLVSGYFFYLGYEKKGDSFFLKNISKLLGIFLVASLFFLPIDIAKGNFKFSQKLLLSGTESHLWFLPSLMFGLIYCWYMMSTLKLFKLLPAIFVFSLLPIILYYYSVGTRFQGFIDLEFARFFLSVSFLSMGLLLAHYNIKITVKRGLYLITIGLIIMFFEVTYFLRHDPIDLWGIQFLINTIPLSLGIFFISFHGYKNTYLANLGRKYSLGIYLYHPFVNMIVYRLILTLFGNISNVILVVNPLICFAVTLTLLIQINRKAPVVFNLLNGEYNRD